MNAKLIGKRAKRKGIDQEYNDLEQNRLFVEYKMRPDLYSQLHYGPEQSEGSCDLRQSLVCRIPDSYKFFLQIKIPLKG